MANKPGEKWRTAWIVVTAIVLYPMSVGPAAFLMGAGKLNDGTARVLRTGYAPLRFLSHGVPQLERLMIRYDQSAEALGSRFR